jgi:acyl dehydratase
VALDPSFIGRRYPPSRPYLVSREKIIEFADAIGAADAVYRDPGAAAKLGHPDVIAPPTFPAVFSMPAIDVITHDPALGLDYSRVVHGDQRIVYTRPVRAGDSLVCVASVEGIISRGGHDLITTRTDAATEAGEPVVTVWTMLVVRGPE